MTTMAESDLCEMADLFPDSTGLPMVSRWPEPGQGAPQVDFPPDESKPMDRRIRSNGHLSVAAVPRQQQMARGQPTSRRTPAV